MIERFFQTLRSYPEIAVFLSLALGYYFGSFTYKGLGLGAVTATLIAAVIIGQIGITISGPLKPLFFLMFLVIDFVASTIAFSLERRHGNDQRDWWLLGHVWLQRFAYRQLFSVVLIKTLRRAIDGRPFAWDKLERTATVTEPVAEAATANTHGD